MQNTRLPFLCLVGLGLALGAGDAAAQRAVYPCVVDGRAVVSDRPCSGGAATGLGAYGETREARTARSTGPGPSTDWRDPPKAADHLHYQSPPCAELAEGIRNGPSRGLGSRAMGELRVSYREKCADDEQRARARLTEEQGKARDARSAQERAERAEADRRKLSSEQCDEMYRIVAGKRKRAAQMTAGERDDFERFESNWRARCPAG